MRNIKLLLLSSAIFALPVLLYLQGEKLTVKEKQVNQIQGSKEVDSLKIVVEYHKKLEAFLQKELLKPAPTQNNVPPAPVVIQTQPVVVYPGATPTPQPSPPVPPIKPVSREDSLRAVRDSLNKANAAAIAAANRESIAAERAAVQERNNQRQADLVFLQNQLREIERNISSIIANRRFNDNYRVELEALYSTRKELTKLISQLR